MKVLFFLSLLSVLSVSTAEFDTDVNYSGRSRGAIPFFLRGTLHPAQAEPSFLLAQSRLDLIFSFPR